MCKSVPCSQPGTLWLCNCHCLSILRRTTRSDVVSLLLATYLLKIALSCCRLYWARHCNCRSVHSSNGRCLRQFCHCIDVISITWPAPPPSTAPSGDARNTNICRHRRFTLFSHSWHNCRCLSAQARMHSPQCTLACLSFVCVNALHRVYNEAACILSVCPSLIHCWS